MKFSSKAPFSSTLVDKLGNLSREWQQFFQLILNAIGYLGQEESFDLTNNTAVAANITPLIFDHQYTSQAMVDYFIQRVHSGTESNEDGTFRVRYNKRANNWTLSNGPSGSGITLSITSAGQVQYTSSNIAGTVSISRIVFRVREMKAKHSTYSRVG